MELRPFDDICILRGATPPPPQLSSAVRRRTADALDFECDQMSLVIANAEIDWHQEKLLSIPPERRPAILSVGAPSLRVANFADEWISADAPIAEWERRARWAMVRAHQRRRIHRRAYVDFLTGLPNRRGLLRGLIREARRCARQDRSLCLVLLDLDGFKAVNDLHGHPEGDRLLRRMGARLLQVTRQDELCGRLGGDEFALVVSGERKNASAAVARVQGEIERLGLSASTALGELRPGESIRLLYQRTDEQLKLAKSQRTGGRRQPPAPPEPHDLPLG